MPDYGSVEAHNTDETPTSVDEESRPFRESTIYYLKEKPATKEQCLKKALLITFPILVAVVVLGLFAAWILHGTDVVNKGEAGQRASNYAPIPAEPENTDEFPAIPTPAPVPAPAPAPKKTIGFKPSGYGSACTANPTCADLKLVGDCCPTKDGKMLGCCG